MSRGSASRGTVARTDEPEGLDAISVTDAREALAEIKAGLQGARWALDALQTQAETLEAILDPVPQAPGREAQS